jgi:hypothetical protein
MKINAYPNFCRAPPPAPPPPQGSQGLLPLISLSEGEFGKWPPTWGQENYKLFYSFADLQLLVITLFFHKLLVTN